MAMNHQGIKYISTSDYPLQLGVELVVFQSVIGVFRYTDLRCSELLPLALLLTIGYWRLLSQTSSAELRSVSTGDRFYRTECPFIT